MRETRAMAGRWNGRFYEGDDTDEVVGGRPSGDDIKGAGGNDTLSGGGAKDNIFGDEGDDVLDGGDGDDFLDAGFAVGGSGDDRAFGGAGDDALRGGIGADLLKGGSGDDDIRWNRTDDGGSARFQDTLIGGEGRDTLALEMDKSFAIDFTLGATAELRAGGVTAATASGFERLEFFGEEYFTKAVSHSVTGGALADFLVAGGGDDTLAGLEGRDDLRGGEGANVLRGGAGRDRLEISVDRETDAVSGGAGVDRLVLDDLALQNDAAFVVEREAPGVVVARLGGEVVVRATSIETLYAEGAAGDDSLTGLARDDELSAGDGADTLRGAAGDDLLLGDKGLDRIFGGAGDDTAVFNDVRGVEVTLAGDRTATAFIDGVADDRLSDVENLSGGGGDDRLTGDAGDNVISGAFLYASGHDTLDGGDGVDTLVLNAVDGGLQIDLGDREFVTAKGDVYAVTHRNFENVVGAKGRDVITGDDKANRLDGWHAADKLTGGGGADVFAFTAFDPRADGADLITDFSRRQGDNVDLSDFVANTRNGLLVAKDFVGNAAFSGTAGEVRFESGDFSRLQIDYNGDGSADFEILFANGAEIGARDVII